MGHFTSGSCKPAPSECNYQRVTNIDFIRYLFHLIVTPSSLVPFCDVWETLQQLTELFDYYWLILHRFAVQFWLLLPTSEIKQTVKYIAHVHGYNVGTFAALRPVWRRVRIPPPQPWESKSHYDRQSVGQSVLLSRRPSGTGDQFFYLLEIFF
jgi:hypothetical protein